MARTKRLSALTLLLVFLASCSDRPDVFTPAAAMSNVAAGANGRGTDGGDNLPADLKAVAEYRVPAGFPGAQVEAAFIGPDGGSVRLGDFEMIVPAGAVDAITRFSIQTFPEGGKGAHAVASFMPHRTFAKPITVRVPLNTTDAAGDPDSHVVWWNGTAWEPMPSNVTADGRLETQTSHFSLYATQCRGFTLVGG